MHRIGLGDRDGAQRSGGEFSAASPGSTIATEARDDMREKQIIESTRGRARVAPACRSGRDDAAVPGMSGVSRQSGPAPPRPGDGRADGRAARLPT